MNSPAAKARSRKGTFCGCIRWEGFEAVSILQHTFGVFEVQFVMYEPFCGRTAAMAHVVLSTRGAGAATHLTVVVEEGRVLPDLPKALRMQVTGLKFGRLEESAGIDLAFWTDAAGSGCRTTHVKAS